MSNNKSVAKAAGLIMIVMIISRLIGFVRDIIINNQFGQSNYTDAYNAAFSIPDFLYMLLVGGALSSAFIPIFSKYISTNREKEGWEIANIVLNIALVLMLVGIAIGYIFTKPLIMLLVSGFDPNDLDLTVKLTRIMFWQAFFMAINGVTFGVLNAYKIFFVPSLGTLLYNLAIIIVGTIWGPAYGITAFAVGVVIGAFLNFAIQIPDLKRIGFRYRFIINLKHPELLRIIGLMLPIMLGLSVGQINLLVNQNIASHLPEGILTALRQGQRIMQVPIGVFAIAIAMTIFPTLTEQVAKKQIFEFKKTSSLGVRSVIFITLPAAIGLIALSIPIIRLLFEYNNGQFTHYNTLVTSDCLIYYCIGLFAQSGIQVLNRVFYALQDTISPVFMGALSIIINIIGSITLVRYLSHGGIALAYSIAGICNLVLLLIWLKRKIGTIGGKLLTISFIKSLFSSCIMGFVIYNLAKYLEITLDISNKFNQLIQVTSCITIGALIYAILAILFKMEEAKLILSILNRRFKKKKA